MFVVHDVFHCKPGKAKELIARFEQVRDALKRHGIREFRILVDYVAEYWTVVLESEVESLADFDHHMQEWGKDEAVRQVMAGYMDLVDHGERKIYRIA